MTEARKTLIILIAEDDEDDRLLVRDALKESRVINEVHFVQDGVELLEFLRREGRHPDAPRPGVILLDLNMPRMDGRTALGEIKSDPALRRIPILVMTTSRAEEDILRSYDLGAASFIPKPVTFEGLVEVMAQLGRYWVEIVELPKS